MQRNGFFKAGLCLAAPVLMGIGALVAGCGGGSGGINPNPTPGPTATPGPTPTPTVPAVADLVFVSNAGGNVDLYFLGATGNAANRLTFDPTSEIQPSLSPDKRFVAFSSTRDGNPEIYTINVGSRVIDRLTEDRGASPPTDDSPVFSAAGDRIAWRTTRGGVSNIFFMQATGANQTRLSDEAEGATDPFWHPDGTRIGYVTKRNGVRRIVLKSIAGGAEQIIALNNDLISNGSISHPRFNRNGDRIVFSSQAPNGASSTLYVINANGGGLQTIAPAGRFNETPVWSSDGTRIIWSASGGALATPQLFSANSDGTNAQRVLTNSDANTDPSTGGSSG